VCLSLSLSFSLTLTLTLSISLSKKNGATMRQTMPSFQRITSLVVDVR